MNKLFVIIILAFTVSMTANAGGWPTGSMKLAVSLLKHKALKVEQRS